MRTLILLICLILGGCTRKELEEKRDAMRLGGAPSVLSDDLEVGSLIEGIDNHIKVLKNSEDGFPLQFGPKEVTRAQYRAALERVKDWANQFGFSSEFWKLLSENFDFYEVYGSKKWGTVFLTSYYEPVIEGSLQKTDRFSSALRSAPNDLVGVELSSYDDRFKNIRTMRGRLEKNPQRMVAYYTREEIEAGALAAQKLELCWVDPLDGFFLQIQGSGRVDLSNGKQLRLGYADQNGHPYVPVGKFLTDAIPLELMTLHTIETHLRSLAEEQTLSVLNKNPSYVFFRKLETRPITAYGVEVIPGRTIATDSRFFPKGALGFLQFKRPVFGKDPKVADRWEPTRRIVFDEDTGGAIRGGGRVDLFWGSGPDAKQSAAVMKDDAKLSYLVPKTDFPITEVPPSSSP